MVQSTNGAAPSGTHLHVETIGTGPDLVMLHGWGQSSAALKPLGELLASSHRVHLVDLPGFGASPAPDRDWSTKEYAECIKSYLERAKISRAILFGHSMGGRISIRIAAGAPERVEKVILLNSHGLQRSRTLGQRARIRAIALLRGIVKFIDSVTGSSLFQTKFIPRFASIDYKNAGALRGTLVRVIREDLSSEAAAISAPTLLVWGEKDTETPLEFGERFRRLIRDSRLIVLPGRGHNPFLDVGAHLCAFHIRPFLGVNAERRSDA